LVDRTNQTGVTSSLIDMMDQTKYSSKKYTQSNKQAKHDCLLPHHCSRQQINWLLPCQWLILLIRQNYSKKCTPNNKTNHINHHNNQANGCSHIVT